ncbi:hypothetical protein AB1E19_010561 [Capra hircus]
MDRGGPAGSPLISSSELAPPVAAARDLSPGRTGPGPSGPGGGARSGGGRPAAANAARERSRVQTLRHAFLELQRTLPSVPPDTKLSKLDVLLLATTYIAHLTRSLQDDAAPADPGLGALRGDGYLHPVKKWPMRSRLYIGATESIGRPRAPPSCVSCPGIPIPVASVHCWAQPSGRRGLGLQVIPGGHLPLPHPVDAASSSPPCLLLNRILCSSAYELKMKIIVINVFQKPVTEDGCENTRRIAAHVTRYQKL